MKPKIVPLGDSALLVQLGDEIDLTINQRVHTLAALIDKSPIEGIIETVPAYGTLLIHYDPLTLEYSKANQWVKSKLEQIRDSESRKPRRIDVFFFSSRRRHTRSLRDWSSDVCSSD